MKGYDLNRKIIIQDDSYQGKNMEYSYTDFLTMWSKFNNEYLVLVPKEKKEKAEQILGKNIDPTYSWQQAKKINEEALLKNPDDMYSRFNLSIAEYYLGEYEQSIQEFEKVENNLPSRTLWYQIEPILVYYELKKYDKVFTLTDSILNNNNRAFSELYLLRGNIYKIQGDKQAAKDEYEKAVFYNKNLIEAQTALNSVM